MAGDLTSPRNMSGTDLDEQRPADADDAGNVRELRVDWATETLRAHAIAPVDPETERAAAGIQRTPHAELRQPTRASEHPAIHGIGAHGEPFDSEKRPRTKVLFSVERGSPRRSSADIEDEGLVVAGRSGEHAFADDEGQAPDADANLESPADRR